MEALIHHFKLVSYGFDVPAGEVYISIESPRGEIGYYVVSDGKNKPWRVQDAAACLLQHLRDSRDDPGRAGRRHGGRHRHRRSRLWGG